MAAPSSGEYGELPEALVLLRLLLGGVALLVAAEHGSISALVLSHAHDVETGILDTSAAKLRSARGGQRASDPPPDRRVRPPGA